MNNLLAALSLFATLSPVLQNWPRGPVQWIMTKDEQRAFSQLKTDQEANDFIDLFWARRDPTPGTERNEFHEQFDKRVRAVDRAFAAGRKRGGLTDMGRVWIVLGEPKESSSASAGVAGSNANGGQGQNYKPDTSRGGDREVAGPASNLGVVARTSARNSFTYDNWLPLGLSKPEVVFIEDGFSQEFKVDPQQANPYGALARAVNAAVVNPELTTTPDWAMHGGIQPKSKASVAKVVIPAKPAASDPVIKGEPGAAHLTLLKNLNVLQLQGGGDPFAGLKSESAFMKSEELGYAFRLCRKEASESNVKVTMRVVGADGQTMSAPADEMAPEDIRVMPACYAVRGAIPLGDFAAGHYRLELQVEDAGQTYELAQELEVR